MTISLYIICFFFGALSASMSIAFVSFSYLAWKELKQPTPETSK